MSVPTASNLAEMDVLPEKLATSVIELNTHLVSELEKLKGNSGRGGAVAGCIDPTPMSEPANR